MALSVATLPMVNDWSPMSRGSHKIRSDPNSSKEAVHNGISNVNKGTIIEARNNAILRMFTFQSDY